MQYLLLIYNNEQNELDMNEEDSKAMFAEYGKFTQGIVESGHFQAGAPCNRHPPLPLCGYATANP